MNFSLTNPSEAAVAAAAARDAGPARSCSGPARAGAASRRGGKAAGRRSRRGRRRRRAGRLRSASPAWASRSRLATCSPAPALEVITYQVKPANLPVTVSERGSLESSKNEDAYCQVEGQTTIIMIVPEGTQVTKGAARLRARLARP